MEKQITIKDLYLELKNLERALQNKGILSQKELHNEDEFIWDWSKETDVLADEQLLSEDWLSPEDEEAWKDL